MGDPVGMALKGDCRGFFDYFALRSDEHLLGYKTANGDSAIHIAAAMENPRLIQKFLERLTPETRLEALKQTDAFGNNGLHEAAVVKDFDVARVLVDFSRKSGDAYKDLVEARNDLGETPVYRAAALGKTKLLQILTEPDGDLRGHIRRDYDDNTILHMAVLGQHFDTAIWLLDQDSSLADKRTKPPTSDELPTSRKPPKSDEHIGFTCLELLALMPDAFKSADDKKGMIKSPFHYRAWIHCLMSGLPTCLDDDYNYKEDIETDKINNRSGHTKKRRGCSWIEEIWKEKKTHEDAVDLVKRLVEITRLNPSSDPQKAETTEQEISETTELEISGTTKTITLGLGKGKDILGKKLVDLSAEELIEVLRKKDGTKDPVEDGENATIQDRTLHFAASNGITEILEEILQRYPQALLSKANELNEQNILHVAVERRQHKVFELIMKEMQLYVPKWAARIDKKGYTLLHHVADMKHYKQGIRTWSCSPISGGVTVVRDQLSKAQEWIKETAQACSVLAILIATVVFTAAFTIPGGNNEKGFPHFLRSPLFYVFTVTDVASLSLSLSSVVMFLSILTSPRESSDFLSNLPFKLTTGFILLFFSVLTSMITFSASLLLIIRLGKKWTATLYAAAIFPVVVLALMEFPVYTNFAANFKDYLGPSKKKKRTH
ncbi:ANK REP REGION domain-containing protein [Citrus sinensis]|uniref:ANK REP REGION domain-containing protein n=1 Tax=Citrus sinensis TaxID=2711 RepID=A0ACB8P147_CITSI|nr:ANK REP REGION domain-containing protein [Citrus sinensis]